MAGTLIKVTRLTVLDADRQYEVAVQGQGSVEAWLGFVKAVTKNEPEAEQILLALRRLGCNAVSVTVRENPVVSHTCWLE